MIYFSNLDQKIIKNIYNFLLSNNFASDLNNFYTKLMIMDSVMPLIKKFKVDKKNLKVLEIGCGNGIHSVLLSELGEVYSTDLEKTTLTLGSNVEKIRFKIFKKYSSKITYKDLNTGINPFKNTKFDIIFHNSVIEHVQNYKNFNKQIYNSLSPGGINVCITGTPNLCIYRLFKNFILRFPLIISYAILKSLLLTKFKSTKLINIIVKRLKKKIWHLNPSYKILEDIAKNIYYLDINKNYNKINKFDLKKYLPSLLHIIREPEYNRIVLKEISKKLEVTEAAVIKNYILYFKEIKNEFIFNLLPQTHSQHTDNIFTEIKEWTIKSWKKSHKIKNFEIKAIVGYRYQHLFGQSFNFRHKIFYRLIKLMSRYLHPSFSSEFIIVTKRVGDI